MGELILKFTEEEFEDARTALDGWRWKMAMQDLDQHLRNEIKYNEQLSADTDKAYEAIRDKIREILHDNNLNIE
jgi:hypothetical protein